jgi:hypothetical protein
MRQRTYVIVSSILSVLLVCSLAWIAFNNGSHYIKQTGSAGFSFSAYSVHATITITKDGEKIFEQYHAGAVTKLGLNVTFAKLLGNATSYNMTQYNLNITSISIGNKGTLTTDSTCLPAEWNRTTASQHDLTYNSANFTAVFHPDTGPYTADCIGINFEDGIGNNALFAYDTFTEVTGIDNTFTITVEFKLSAS